MKKIILIFSIIFLIILTTVTKNSTKKLENQIFIVQENISFLKDQYEMVLLDHNYLTSPQKLMEYQSKYFEKDLVPMDVSKIKEIKEIKNQLLIQNLNKIKKEYEKK
tara:strand:- start:1329 stop:1649 length:321 start_codon:yes stop_codon:yes gene_type:complete